MSSSRSLLLVTTKYTKHTIHTCSNIERTTISHSLLIYKLKSTQVLSANYNAACSNVSHFSSSSITLDDKMDNESNEEQMPVHHPIMSMLDDCRTFKDCYHRIVHATEYASLLSDADSSYTYQHHKYFILKLIHKASRDQSLGWQMIANLIAFYSKFDEKYRVPTQSIYNFLSILARRGDFNAVSSIIEQLLPSSSSAAADRERSDIAINQQLFALLIQALRVGGQHEEAYSVFKQSINEFNLQPTIPLLLQGYMSKPSKWRYNAITLLNQYNLSCDHSAYHDVIDFHLQCIADECEKTKNLKNSDNPRFKFDEIDIYKLPPDVQQEYAALSRHHIDPSRMASKRGNDVSAEAILSNIQIHGQRVLFYLNHAHQNNRLLDTATFHRIITVIFDHMLHNRLSAMLRTENDSTFSQWIAKYLQHILQEQLRNHSATLEAWKSSLSKHLLPVLFEGCLHRNQVELSRQLWQLCESNDIFIDATSRKHYNDLAKRHFMRHGKRPPTNSDSSPSGTDSELYEYTDSQLKLSVFPADSHNRPSSGLPAPNAECQKLAKNLLQRARDIALLDTLNEHAANVPSYGDERISFAKQSEPHAKKAFLTDVEHAIVYCRKYDDIISARMLYQAFLDSKLSFLRHPKLATDFLFVLDVPQFRQYVTYGLSDDAAYPSLVISPQDVLTLWPLHPPQAFINKAFNILMSYQHAEGVKKIFDAVIVRALSHDEKPLLLSPRMLTLGSDLFAVQCEKEEQLIHNAYWEYLWKLMESKHFKEARTSHSVSYVGSKLLNILFHHVNADELTEDEMIGHVKRIYGTFKHYGLSLPLPLMQKLHANMKNALHKSWIRQIYLEQHHPNEAVRADEVTASSMHIMNDYRWYIDAELFNQSMEHGLYENMKPLRKLMIDGTIPASHRLVHRILLTFSKSNNLYLAELQQFLVECTAHYQHAFSPKEKSLIAGMVKRYISQNDIQNIEQDNQVSSIVAYLQSVNIPIHLNSSPHLHSSRRRNGFQSQRKPTPFLKHINPQNPDNPTMSDAVRFQVGETVQLCALQGSAYLNGCIGTVVGYYNETHRAYPVQLENNPHVVYVAAKNMRFAKKIINPVLPELDISKLLPSDNKTETLLLPATSNPSMSASSSISLPPTAITPFDAKQQKPYLRNKLLHIFRDQRALNVQSGICLSRFKEIWKLYFPHQQFYANDENLHDWIIMYTSLYIDYTWNVHEFPDKPLQRIYFLSQNAVDIAARNDQHRLQSAKQFCSYLRNLVESQPNHRMRLKDLCKACDSEIYELLNIIRQNHCVNILHFLNHHHNQFEIETINGEKYVSLKTKKKVGTHSVPPSVCDIENGSVYDVQYWLWNLYQHKKDTHNLSSSELNTILSLFEGHHIDGHALTRLTSSDLSKMGIISLGIQKVLLSALQEATETHVSEVETTEPSADAIQPSQIMIPPVLESVDIFKEDTETLCTGNMYECLLNHHEKFPAEDSCIYQHEVLQFYGMNEDSDYRWYLRCLLDYYYEQFHISYYHDENRRKCVKVYMRSEMSTVELSEDELRKEIKQIVEEHPIGIDLVSLLHEFELTHNGRVFRHNTRFDTLSDRLKQMNFIVTASSHGYVVFDAYY